LTNSIVSVEPTGSSWKCQHLLLWSRAFGEEVCVSYV